MTPTVGLVLMNLTSTDQVVVSQIHEAMQVTPQGRVLAIAFDLPHDWSSSYPWESEISKAVLGRPSQRTTDPEWQLLATVAVRCCSIRREHRSVKREIGVALFVKRGEKAYARRKSVSRSVLDSSRLNSLHSVFTRDVANNVWHLSSSNAFLELKRRLIGLHTWSDEVTLIFRKGRVTREAHSPLDLSRAAIGVPTKVPYKW